MSKVYTIGLQKYRHENLEFCGKDLQFICCLLLQITICEVALIMLKTTDKKTLQNSSQVQGYNARKVNCSCVYSLRTY